MKNFIILSILTINSLCATEAPPKREPESHYRYVKLSDQWIYRPIFPGLGVGYRSHASRHGWDIDLTAFSYWELGFSLYGKGHYLFYPTQKNFYLGIGPGVIGGWISVYFAGLKIYDGVFIKPTLEGILGFEWNTEKSPLFLQLELGGSYGNIRFYPALSFGAGF